MTSRRILQYCLALGALGTCLAEAPFAHAVTTYTQRRNPFLFDITTFTASLSLPVTDQIETVRMTENQLMQRLVRSKHDETVEPLTLLMNDDEPSIAAMTEKLALQSSVSEFSDYLKDRLQASKPTKKGAISKTIELTKEGLDLMDKDAYVDMFARPHHALTLQSTEVARNKDMRAELMNQLTPFFKSDERDAIQKRLNKGEPIKIDLDLLPEFAKKMVRKYIIFRGPNCFHAALAFHSPQMTSSSLVNVKKETGYHRAMINYDELWRAINRNFYEINPDKQPLKYGDMLVFFEVPEEDEDNLDKPVDFRWIRHTATYLFSGYTFSKGSKSPNTPYTVRTLAEEWKTWKRYTKNLGIKVYRRSQKTVRLSPPMDLTDWMY